MPVRNAIGDVIGRPNIPGLLFYSWFFPRAFATQTGYVEYAWNFIARPNRMINPIACILFLGFAYSVGCFPAFKGNIDFYADRAIQYGTDRFFENVLALGSNGFIYELPDLAHNVCPACIAHWLQALLTFLCMLNYYRAYQPQEPQEPEDEEDLGNYSPLVHLVQTQTAQRRIVSYVRDCLPGINFPDWTGAREIPDYIIANAETGNLDDFALFLKEASEVNMQVREYLIRQGRITADRCVWSSNHDHCTVLHEVPLHDILVPEYPRRPIFNPADLPPSPPAEPYLQPQPAPAADQDLNDLELPGRIDITPDETDDESEVFRPALIDTDSDNDSDSSSDASSDWEFNHLQNPPPRGVRLEFAPQPGALPDLEQRRHAAQQQDLLAEGSEWYPISISSSDSEATEAMPDAPQAHHHAESDDDHDMVN